MANAIVRRELLKLLKVGVSLQDVSKRFGVTYQTLLNECKRDPAFGTQVRQAGVEGKIALIQRVEAASKRDAKWAAWMLERKYWSEWAKRSPDSITHGQLSIALNRFIGALLEIVPTDFHRQISEESARMLENLFIVNETSDG